MQGWLVKNLKLIVLGLAGLSVLILRLTGHLDFITLESVRDYLMGFGAWMPLAYFVAFLGLSLLFVPNSMLILLASFLFEPREAIALSLAATLATAVISYVIGRYGAEGRWQRFLKEGSTVRELYERLAHRQVLLVLALRYTPLPSTVQSLLCGALKIRPAQYVFASVIEALPWIVGFAFAGEGFLTGNARYLILGVGLFLFAYLAAKLFERKEKSSSSS